MKIKSIIFVINKSIKSLLNESHVEKLVAFVSHRNSLPSTCRTGWFIPSRQPRISWENRRGMGSSHPPLPSFASQPQCVIFPKPEASSVLCFTFPSFSDACCTFHCAHLLGLLRILANFIKKILALWLHFSRQMDLWLGKTGHERGGACQRAPP